MRKPQEILVVVGPTASGKTRLAVELALTLNGEVVSSDSMQIYTGMDIATAKPTAAEMRGVPHHLIDFVPPSQSYSVADYVEDAKKAIESIVERGRLPVLCGGTGLYADALVRNMDFGATAVDEQVRERLQRQLEKQGAEKMHAILEGRDPELAAKLHPNNTTRVLRALETIEVTGEKMSVLQRRALDTEQIFAPVFIGLDFADRNHLYERIDMRVDQMVEDGLVGEAMEVYQNRSGKTAVQAIGYKELFAYFDGEGTLLDGIEKIKKRTRNYAKRQLTWLRRNEEINWIRVERETTSAQITQQALKIAHDKLPRGEAQG